MTVSITTNLFRSNGEPQVLKIFEMGIDDIVPIPDGSNILYVEFLKDTDTIEVWASVPSSSILSSNTKEIETTETYIGDGPIGIGNSLESTPEPTSMSMEDILTIEEGDDGSPIIFLNGALDRFENNEN